MDVRTSELVSRILVDPQKRKEWYKLAFGKGGIVIFEDKKITVVSASHPKKHMFPPETS